MSTIKGPTLLGFSDYFSNDDVGAALPKGKAPVRAPSKTAPAKPGAAPAAPKGKAGKYFRAYPKISRTQSMRNQGKVLSKAKETLLKAAQRLGSAQMTLSRKPMALPQALARKTAPTALVRSAPATAAVRSMVRPAVAPRPKTMSARPMVGAAQKLSPVEVKRLLNAAKTAKNLTPKAQLALKKYAAAATKGKAAAKNLAQHALKTRTTVKNLAKTMLAQKKVSKLLRTPVKRRPAGKTTVGQILVGLATEEAFNEFYTLLGAAPDPANPGYLTDGSLDPAYFYDDSTGDASADASLDPGLSDLDMSLFDEPVDSGVELPAPPGMDVFIPDMNAVGGIAYDGSKGFPNGFCGSYGLFTKGTEEDAPGMAISGSDSGRNYYGYVWGSFDQDQVPNGVPYGGRLKEGVWHSLHGRWVRSGEGSWSDDVGDAEAFASHQKYAPNGIPYGPLVGNPGMADFKAMRVDGQGNMFWLPQEAPDWLTFPIKQAAAVTAKAEAEAAAAEKKAWQAEQEKARMDEQAMQAAQDAANALAESQAASEAKIAEGQAQTQMQQAEVDAAHALITQQQQDTAAEQLELDQAKQTGDMLLAQAQRQEQYFAQNPDLEMALTLQAQGLLGPDEGTEEQGDEEYAEEEEPAGDPAEMSTAEFEQGADVEEAPLPGFDGGEDFFSDSDGW